jgi:copper(I)-binding protein
MAVIDDVMQMSQLPDGLEIPAGETVTLAPGGLHLMFMQISQPFVEGETVPVTLTFEHAGEIEIELAVEAFGASSMSDHSEHEGH